MWGKSVVEVARERENEIHKELLRHCPCEPCYNQRISDFVDSLSTRGNAAYHHAKKRVEDIMFHGSNIGDVMAIEESEVEGAKGLYRYKGDGYFERISE